MVIVDIKFQSRGELVVNLREHGTVGIFGTISSYIEQKFSVKKKLTILFCLDLPLKLLLILVKCQI